MHSALLVESDQTLRDLLVPAVRGALAEAGEVFAVVPPRTAGVLRAGLGPDAAALRWRDPAASCQRLGFAYEAFRRFLAGAHAAGRRVWVFAEPDPSGPGRGQAGADRTAACLAYESVCNETYAAYKSPVTCLWDTRRHAPDVIDSVRRLHSHQVSAAGMVPSPDYRGPGRYLADLPPVALPRPARPDWAVTLATPGDLPGLRGKVRAWARGQRFAAAAAADVTLAVNEVATNGLAHGRPPVTVLGWHDGDLLIAQVEDRGGIPLPAAGGYRPPEAGQDRAHGLWLARQLADVMRSHTADGQTTVRLYFPHQLTHRWPWYLSAPDQQRAPG